MDRPPDLGTAGRLDDPPVAMEIVSVPVSQPPIDTTLTTFIGMLARPFWLRNDSKSFCTLVMLPCVMIPTLIVDAVAVLPAL